MKLKIALLIIVASLGNLFSCRTSSKSQLLIFGEPIEQEIYDQIAPYMAKLYVYDRSRNATLLLCSAIMLSDSSVLTAAHCLTNQQNSLRDYGTRFSKTLLYIQPFNSDLYLTVDDYSFPHPFNSSLDFPLSNDNNFYHKDLALLKLSDKFQNFPAKNPLKLFSNEPEILEKSKNSASKFIIAGYGFKTNKDGPCSDVRDPSLMMTSLQLKSLVNHSILGEKLDLVDFREINGVCPGDSGGGTFLVNQDEIGLVGINSAIGGFKSFIQQNSSFESQLIFPYLNQISANTLELIQLPKVEPTNKPFLDKIRAPGDVFALSPKELAAINPLDLNLFAEYIRQSTIQQSNQFLSLDSDYYKSPNAHILLNQIFERQKPTFTLNYEITKHNSPYLKMLFNYSSAIDIFNIYGDFRADFTSDYLSKARLAAKIYGSSTFHLDNLGSKTSSLEVFGGSIVSIAENSGPAIETIVFTNTSIEDVVFKKICLGFPKLKSLYLVDAKIPSKVTDETICPNLVSISINNSTLSEFKLNKLQSINLITIKGPQLKSIYIAHNEGDHLQINLFANPQSASLCKMLPMDSVSCIPDPFPLAQNAKEWCVNHLNQAIPNDSPKIEGFFSKMRDIANPTPSDPLNTLPPHLVKEEVCPKMEAWQTPLQGQEASPLTILKTNSNGHILQGGDESKIYFESIHQINGIEFFDKLKSVTLVENLIEDISPLAKLPDLQILYLNHNRVRSLEPLRNSSKLKELWVGSNCLGDDTDDIYRILNSKKDLSIVSIYRNFLKLPEKIVLPGAEINIADNPLSTDSHARFCFP